VNRLLRSLVICLAKDTSGSNLTAISQIMIHFARHVYVYACNVDEARPRLENGEAASQSAVSDHTILGALLKVDPVSIGLLCQVSQHHTGV